MVMQIRLPLLTLVCAVSLLSATAQAASASMQARSERLVAEGVAIGDQQAAKFLLEQAIVADPANASALGALANLYVKMGKPAPALKYYSTALLVDPTNVAALAGSAQLEIAGGKPDAAKAHLQVLKVVCPTCAETRNIESALSNPSQP